MVWHSIKDFSNPVTFIIKNMDLKYHDLQTLFSLVETQLLVVGNITKQEVDAERKKLLKSEAKEMKALKVKLNTAIREY
jgi:hypothetical protein